MKRILLTGAAGFIGAHMVEHLLKNTDWEIVIFDKLTYASDGLGRLRDTGVLKNNRVELFACDITKPISDGTIKEIDKVNYIVHMAAETHVDNSISGPRAFVEANVMGTFEMLEFARKLSGLEKFIYFSTDEVFGPAKTGYAFKEWERYNSTNPYSATKAGGEELCLAWANTFGVPVGITHTMNNFGERQHPEKFIPSVVRKILSGETIHIHSNKDKTVSGSRFYIHCRNTSDAILYLLNYINVTRDKFNIVGEKEVSNLDLVLTIHKLLEKVTGSSHKLYYDLVDFHSSRPGHDLRYALDGTKMKTLGWAPPNSFEDSLEKAVRWMVDPKNVRWLLMKQQQEVAG